MNEAHGQKVDDLIRVWDEKIAVLVAQADKINAGQKLIYQEYLQSLQTRRQEVLEMLGELFVPVQETAPAALGKEEGLSGHDRR